MGIADLFANGKKPNLLFIITDQERSLQHWPANFVHENLPAMTKLQHTGLSFSQAFTNSCLCCPSRATFMTSQYPTLTGVTATGSPGPPFDLPADLVNLATVLNHAGYTCAWRGKWHLGGNGPQDYGFTSWNPPDSGNYLSLNDTLGGGSPDNDGRSLKDIFDFIDEAKNLNQPFCLVASFVNPHDVYVAQYGPALGYTEADFAKIKVPLPTNCNEDLNDNDKPRAQVYMSWPYVTHENSQQDYVNFYAYLQTVVDGQIMQLLNRLDQYNLTDDTLIIRTADHGEQALSHGLVEKFFNTYEESLHIPLVLSNPIAYPKPQVTDSLASLLDVVPTLAHLLGLAKHFPNCFYGRNLTSILQDPTKSVQDCIHFTYDDIPSRAGPSIIRCIRTARYKYAVYFTQDGDDADWELYDLKEDAKEDFNLAGQLAYAKIQSTLDERLQQVMQEMKTEPEFEWPPTATEGSIGFSSPQDL